MSKKIKLLVEVDEETYNRAKNEPPIICGMNDELIYQSNIKEAIAKGTPIADDIISRNDLLEELQDYIECNQNLSGIFETMKVIVNDVPTIEGRIHDEGIEDE